MNFEFPTKQQQRTFFESKEVQQVLKFTESEEKAISKYQGTGAIQINELMGNFLSDNAVTIKGKSYYASQNHGNTENIEDLMNTIQNIYSAMVKQFFVSELSGEYRGRMHLYRGAANPLKSDNNSFISTTTSMNEALLFATSNNRNAREHYLIDISTDKDVLSLYMPHSGNENEILLSPFVTVTSKSKERGEKWGTPIIREFVDIKSTQLKELSGEEIQSLQGSVLGNVDEISNLIPECLSLQKSVRKLLEDIDFAVENKRNTLNRLIHSPDYKETKKYLDERIEGLTVECEAKKQELEYKSSIITEWKNKFRLLMEGKCSQIEKDLYNQINQIREAEIKKQEEKKRQEAELIAQKKQEEERKRENSVQIKNRVEDVKRDSEIALSYAKKVNIDMKRTGVQYDSQVERALLAIRSISYTRELSSDMAVNNISQISDLPQNLAKTQSDLIYAEEEAFKRALESRIIEIRLMQEQRIVSQELQQIKSEKIGLIGRVSGKMKKQEEEAKTKSEELQKVQAISAQIKSNGLSQDVRYSIHEMLAEIELAKSKGMLSVAELQELEKNKKAIETIYAPFVRDGKKFDPIEKVRLKKELDKRIQEDNNGQRTTGLISRVSTKISRELKGKIKITSTERVCNEVRNMVDTIERAEMYSEKEQTRYGINH